MSANTVLSPPLSTTKKMPYSQEAEQSVIGALMLNNDAFDAVSECIGSEDFYQVQHRLIFEHINRAVQKNTPFDVLTLSESIGSDHYPLYTELALITDKE